MMELDFINLVTQVGFPIVISLWFMLRTEKVIQANTEVLMMIHEVISKCPKNRKI